MAKANDGKVQFGPPGRGKDAASRAITGRHCDYPGCATVLSTYNASSTCWLHTGPATRHALYHGKG
jgi:hypothetical protein